ncbi:MAG: TIGR03000 domain-containing protein [Pirellulaceae bacterium]|nr:TIGR03000 domain-containing protein [Pirellulaceae bacterium]
MVQVNKKWVIVIAMVLAALVVSAPRADACWGWGCGWGSCYSTASYYTPCCTSYGWWSPCYTSCYSSCCYDSCCDPCGGSWYVGYRPGPIRRALLGPYRWYYANSYCYDCCSTTCCCDDAVSTCGPSATTLTPSAEQPTVAPLQQPTEGDALEAPAPPAAGTMNMQMMSLPTRENSGLLTVWVPAAAKVFINGKETTTQGSRRRYVSHGLQPGLTYKYEVRAELVRDGMIAEETKTVYLTAGASDGVAFGFNQEPINQIAAQQ